MADNNYIFSTLSNDFNFAIYEIGTDGFPRATKHIYVRGGAQLAELSGPGFDTPLAKMTRVSDADLELLKQDWTFRNFLEHGYIRIEQSAIDIEKAAGQMELPTTEEGAPMTESAVEKIATPKGLKVKVVD